MKRLPMRKIREALRLRADGFSGRQVAQSLAVGRATISEYFRRADVEGLRWPLPADLSDAELERRLFPYSRGEAPRTRDQLRDLLVPKLMPCEIRLCSADKVGVVG